jgi:hypothetical protein
MQCGSRVLGSDGGTARCLLFLIIGCLYEEWATKKVTADFVSRRDSGRLPQAVAPQPTSHRPPVATDGRRLPVEGGLLDCTFYPRPVVLNHPLVLLWRLFSGFRQ